MNLVKYPNLLIGLPIVGLGIICIYASLFDLLGNRLAPLPLIIVALFAGLSGIASGLYFALRYSK